MKSKVLLTAILFILAVKAACAAAPAIASVNPSVGGGTPVTINGSKPGNPNGNGPTSAARGVINNTQAPDEQATNVTFSSILATSVSVSWIPGDGTARAVFVSKGSSGSPAPLNNTNYNANAAFGSGDQIGSTGWYCVYNGSDSEVGVTGLTKATTYNVMVVEYNGSSFSEQYLTTAGTGNPATVMTTPPPFISYSSPQLYTENVAIPQLVPTSRNVGDNAYAVSIASIGSGFSGPTGVAIDAAGDVYVADYGDKLVKKIPVGGGSPVIVGSGFSAPIAVALDRSGNLYVADYGSHSIFEVPAGGGSPQKLSSNFNQPTGVAVDGAGNVYVADAGNNAVYELPEGSTARWTLGGGFSGPSGVAVDGMGNVYIADTGNRALKEIPIGSNAPYIVFDTSTPPYGVAVDAIGDIFVTEGGAGFGAVEEYVLSGNLAGFGTGLSSPDGLTVDGTGKVYVADQGNNLVKEMTPGGGYFINKALPTGLYFDTNTGIISRIPTSLSSATNYTVTMYNSAGSASATVNITVLPDNANLSNLQISNSPLTLQPSFSTNTISYTANVGNGIASTTITPTAANPGATIMVNNMPVTSGSLSQSLPLVVGSNPVTIVVTSPGGAITKTYSMTITRAASGNANLSSLKRSSGTLIPTFSASVTTYTENVDNGTATMNVTPTKADANAAITVNGTTVASGRVSPTYNLTAGGATVITTVVTAQNGTTKTYTLTVNRPLSSDASLSGLHISAGVLAPGFQALTQLDAYSAKVSSSTTTIMVTPTATSASIQGITVNTAAATSGWPSGPVSLNPGANPITIVVTAQNGATRTYTLTINRTNNDASLANLQVSVGTLTPPFQPLTQRSAYSVSEVSGVNSVDLTPTTTDPNATVTINTNTATSGQPTTMPVSAGSNPVTIVVTASDGSTKRTYDLIVNVASTGADDVYQPVSVEKPADSPTLNNDGITVHQAVSPNGDGINDFLQIDNISQYPDNKLSILNRSGQLIYEANGYDNNSKVFDGHSNKNGQMQLPGTYFYSLEYKVGNITKRKTGVIVLKY